ncbi:BspA family leucine-rich repeat surface protein, partial [Parapedobacter sp.]
MERFLPLLSVKSLRLFTTLLFVTLTSLVALAQEPFVMTWTTTTANESIVIPTNPDFAGSYNYTVNWGDGESDAGQTGDATHTYASPDTYRVSITGSFPAIQIAQEGSANAEKLTSIEQWGDISWHSMASAFSGASTMVLNATDAPDLSRVTSMEKMFFGASSFNADLSAWDVSGITNMSNMFYSAFAFNGNISNWNVSSVTNMHGMFWQASVFNQNIGGWDVGNVTDMSYMFYQAPVFNQDLSGWDVSRVTTMNSMFFIALGFDQSLGGWDISNVADMDDMLLSTGLSSANYGATLIGWATLPTVPSNITLDATGQEYCPGTAAETAREQLIAKGWTITGDAEATDCSGGGTEGAFITTWKTTAADESISIPINPHVDGYDYTVDWGDGSAPAHYAKENATHTYATAGTHIVSITGNFPAIQFGNVATGPGNAAKLFTIEQWGTQAWQDMTQAFRGCVNLTKESDTDAPVFVPGITLDQMFLGCSAFDSDLSDWDVSQVGDMSNMFVSATVFNHPLATWDVGNVTSMFAMFSRASAFNQAIGNWDVSKVTNMTAMFADASTFNQPVEGWNVLKVTNMGQMFDNASAFNQPLAGWDVSNVIDMGSMFRNAVAFNQPIGNWNVSKVRSMQEMFLGAAAFDQSLGNWDLASIMYTTPPFMDIKSDGLVDMLNNSGLSTEHYDATLIGWSNQTQLPQNQPLGALGLTYCAGADARQKLVEDHGWEITGDATNCAGQIYVKTPTGETLTIAAESSDAIQQIKQKIEDQKNIPVDQQRLVFEGQELQDGRTLGDYSIAGGSTLYLWLAIEPGTAGILYVDINVNATASGYTGVGDSWANAVPQLRDALGWAASNWDGGTDGTLQIWVADGTYYPTGEETDRAASFRLVNNVAIYGGFAGEPSETALNQRNFKANPTELSGDINGDGALTGNAYHVVNGAGVNGSALLDGFTVMGGNADGDANAGSGSNEGGGLYANGGGPMIANTMFIGNYAAANGGGAVFSSAYGSVLKNVLFAGNEADEGGGLFAENSQITVANATFTGNTGRTRGGAIISGWNGSLSLNNSILWGNVAGGSETSPTASYYNAGGGLPITASLVANEGGEDPLFTDPAAADYTLQAGSPAIGMGDNEAYTEAGGDLVNDFDLAGNPRVYNQSGGGIIDMGAYEYQGELNTPPTAVDDEVTLQENIPTTGNVLTNDDDVDGNALTASLVTAPVNGTVVLNADGSFTYTPNDDYSGLDSLVYQTCDNGTPSLCDTASVFFTIEAIEPIPIPGTGNILYVDINVNTTASGYTGAGDNWANAIPELADALKWAREQHDGGSPGWTETEPLRIFVAKGTYLPLYSAADGQYTTDGGRDNSFVLVPDVQVYGGFDPSAGVETLEDARILPTMNSLEQGSVLSGDFNGNDHTDNYDNHTENAHHVTIAAGDVGNALMDGFTVTGGYASGNTSGPSVMGQTVYRFFGGGTYVVTSSPQFTHMAWFDNLGEWGGGLFNTVSLLTQTSLPKLSNVTFYRNMAPGGGGGIRNFEGSIDINQAVFANNGAGLVEDGTSSGPGGGIHTSGDGTSLSITNATFYGNWIVGVFIPQFDGGALFVEQTSTLLNNVVIWGNEVEGDPADPSASISVSTLGTDVTVANSLVAHSGGSANWNNAMGILDGGGNIDTDPLFVGTTPGAPGYLQLSACSPAISMGSNQLYIDAGGNLADDLDMGGNPRVYDFAGDGVIDMGAYEYQGERVLVQSLTMPDAVQVSYGTALADVENAPTTVMATLSDGTEVSIPLDGNLSNWTLASPADGTYDGDVAGTYVFTVPLSIPETECYLNPENRAAEVTIVVAKGTPVLAASWNGVAIDATEGLSLTYGDLGELLASTSAPDGELTYSFGDRDTPVLDLANLGAVAAQQAGTATLTIGQEETANYQAAAVEIPVAVAPKAVTVVPTADQGKVYGTVEPTTYGYELAEGDALAFDDGLADIVSSTSRETGEDVGAYDIELVFGGDRAGNYAITFEADNNAFTVTPLAITVTAEHKSKVFGTADPALTYTFTPELVGDDAFTGGLDREAGEDAGTYAITQGTLSLDDNYALTFAAGILTITPAAYEGIEFHDASFVYDGSEHVLELTGELPEGTSVGYEIDGEPGNGATDAGAYGITALIDGGNNYEDLELTATLAITPLEITVTAADKAKVFGTADPALTYTFTPKLVGDDAFTGGLDREAGEDVGTYAITQGNLDLGDNYEVSFVEGTFTITPAAYEGIEFNDDSFEYDGTEHVLELAGDLPEGATVTYEIGGETGNGATDAGAYEITALIDGGNNYEDAELTATLTITPLGITVTAEDKTKLFGSEDPALTYTFTPELIGDDAFTGSLTRAEGENVGEYAIRQGDLSLNDNYEIAFEAGTLTIRSAGYEGVELNDGSFVYDGTGHTLELTGELPEGVTVMYEIDGEPGNGATDAGSYEIVAIIDGGGNYEDGELTAMLTITPLEIAVAAIDQTRIFGSEDPPLTYTSAPELVGDDTFTGSLDRAEGENVGSYAITQGNLSLGDNYEITFEAGTLTITPAEIQGIAFNNSSSTYDGTEHRLTLAGELPAGASVTYDDNSRTDVGAQEVTATIRGSNYETLVLKATLTVLPAARTLDFPPLPEKTYGDDSFDAGAEASTGEPVIYTSSNTDVAEVSADGEITITGAGETTITATVPENANYSSRPQESRVLTVRKASQTITLNGPAEVDRDAGSIALTASSTSELPVTLTADNAEVATL